MRPAASLAFIDVETNGLGPDARIIEIAVVNVDAVTGETLTFTSFVHGDGRAGPHWVHGITDDDLRSAPLFEEIWPEVSRFIRGRVIVAHNEKFDRRIVNAELARIGEPELPRFLCTLDLAYSLGYARRKAGSNPGVSGKLSDLAVRFGLTTHPTHRALTDAQTCRNLYQYFAEHHPNDVANALSLVVAVEGIKETIEIAADHRKPIIIIVDSANINERRRGRQWYVEGVAKELQVWSYEHFFDFHKNLRLHIPGAVILCFFDERSSERCVTVDDESGLIYSFSRAPHDALKLFKVPRNFSADDVIVALAKKVGAFVISGDHFAEQEDSNEWRKSEMQFYAQFPKSTQSWNFINKNDVDARARKQRTFSDVVAALDLRDATKSERDQIASFADDFAENFYKDRDNVKGRTLLRRYRNTPRLGNQIVIGNIDLAEVSEKSRESAVSARAYRIPLLKKYLKREVTVIGRLSSDNSSFNLEWFKSYKPIKVIPEDTTSFRERTQSRQFVEVSGVLTESSGVLILKSARIEKVLEFADLVRTNLDQAPRATSYAKIGRFINPRARQMIRQLPPMTARPTSRLPDEPFIKNSDLILDDFLDTSLPNPPKQRFGTRRLIAISLFVLVGGIVWFFLGDLSQSVFGSWGTQAEPLAKISAVRATYR
jgi:DNA polymerase III epsilon subunit family exonuclease